MNDVDCMCCCTRNNLHDLLYTIKSIQCLYVMKYSGVNQNNSPFIFIKPVAVHTTPVCSSLTWWTSIRHPDIQIKIRWHVFDDNGTKLSNYGRLLVGHLAVGLSVCVSIGLAYTNLFWHLENTGTREVLEGVRLGVFQWLLRL